MPDHGSTAFVPLWLKAGYTVFVLVMVPIWLRQYGPSNFLWFSDIALFLTTIALWTENRLLASAMLLAVAIPELAWNVDFFARLIAGRRFVGLAEYMFDPTIPRLVRIMSLFHITLPITLVWLVYRLGYDRRALAVQTLIAIVVLPLSYAASTPEDNINWVYGFGDEPQQWVRPGLYVVGLMIFFPLAIYLPTHVIVGHVLKW